MTRSGKTVVDTLSAVYVLDWQVKHLVTFLPWPQREVLFHPTRKWKFDLAWPAPLLKIAVEIDGGIWRKGGGAHTGTGHIRDIEKNREAVICGYRVLHFIPEEIVDRHGRNITTALDTIVRLFATLGIKEIPNVKTARNT